MAWHRSGDMPLWEPMVTSRIHFIYVVLGLSVLKQLDTKYLIELKSVKDEAPFTNIHLFQSWQE